MEIVHGRGSHNQLLRVSTGATWGNTVLFLKANDAHTVHGDCPTVGVVGCCLHGCFHMAALSNRYGLCVDLIRGFTIVLMDGRVMNVTHSTATEVEPSDFTQVLRQGADITALGKKLWFGVRGAGSSLG